MSTKKNSLHFSPPLKFLKFVRQSRRRGSKRRLVFALVSATETVAIHDIFLLPPEHFRIQGVESCSGQEVLQPGASIVIALLREEEP